jgi:hypothetical protein
MKLGCDDLASLRLDSLDSLLSLVIDHSLLLEVFDLEPVSAVHMSNRVHSAAL